MEKAYFNIKNLGQLYIDETFVYYDEPLMFSCKNVLGNLFLLNCIDKTDEFTKWVILPLSEKRLLEAAQGKIDARSLYTKSEENLLWEMKEYYDDSKSLIANLISIEELDDLDLPDEGVNLLLDYESERSINDMTSLSNVERKGILDLSLEYNNNHGHEIPTDVLTKTLRNVQNLVYSIGHKSGSMRLKYPEKVIQDNELVIDSLYAASFGLRFKTKSYSNVIGELGKTNSLMELMYLLSLDSDAENLTDYLQRQNPRVGKYYYELLKVLAESNTAYKAYFANPQKAYKEAFMTEESIRNNIEIIEKGEIVNNSEIKLNGTLVGINVEKNNFMFITKDGIKYEGKILQDIDHDEYTVPCEADVLIDELCEFNSITKKESIKYILKDVKEINKKSLI